MPNEQVMPRNGARGDSDSTGEGVRTNRRTYLKAAGAAVASVPLLAGEGAAESRHGISFDNVVDMVDDAGCDPNGNSACDGKLQSAAGSNTLLKFPSGTYKFNGKNALNGYDNFGIVGEGDVTFVVSGGFDDKLLTINNGNGLLIENITVDQNGATPLVQCAPDDNLQVHGLSIVGQGRASSDAASDAFAAAVRSSGGQGVVSNLTAHNAGKMGAYARTGIWVGSNHKGTLTLRNCNVEGFSNNGVYASRTPGAVQVEGGTYKNNDLSQVRIGSSGSYVDGATIETDLSDSNSPNPDDMLNGSGIRLESDRGGSGAEVRNCDVRIGPEVNADGGIQIFGNYPSFSIKNTRVEFNPDKAYAIRGKSPNGSSGNAGGTLKNVSVTGNASNAVGVLIEDRPNTTIEDSCIQQTGGGRVGIALHNCDGSRVANTTVNASAQAVRVKSGNVNVSNIQESGTCPAPSLGSSNYTGSSSSGSDGSSGEDTSSESSSNDDSSDSSSGGSSEDSSSSDGSSDDSSSDSGSSDEESSDDGSSDSDSSESSSDEASDDSSDDSSSGNSDGAGSDDKLSGNIDESDVPKPSDSANFVVTDTDTSGGRIPYELATSGDLEKAKTGGATADDNDDISENTASGGVNEWRDSYEYEGEIVELEVDDRAILKLDADTQTIKVIGKESTGPTDYSLEVTGELEHADSSSDPITDDGQSVEGGVGNSRDVYNYTGRLLEASVEDSVSITTQPESLDN